MRPAPTPFMILHAWAEARATLFGFGEYASLREATAPLVDYAHESGLVEQAGIDAVRKLIAWIFDINLSATTNE
jgi:hypothetical protein